MTDGIGIREGGLNEPKVIALLQTHLDAMHALSPPESTHALDLDGLRGPGMSFWSVWDGEKLLAVGALKRLSETDGEIKSMHTAQAARGRRIAVRLLSHIETMAKANGLTRLYLETGTPSGFAAARHLYQRAGYCECPPFADYKLDPFSVFMTKTF